MGKKESQIILPFGIGLIGLLAARDIGGISYNKLILIGYVLCFAIFAGYKDLSMMICFMFPLTWGLPYTYIFLGTIVLYWIKRREIPIRALLLILFFALLEVIASWFYPKPDFARVLKYLSVIAVFFTFRYDTETDKGGCIQAFYCGSIVLCLIILISTIKNAPSNWLYLFSRGWFRFGNRQADNAEGMMLSVNANTLAYYSVIGISFSCCFLPGTKGSAKWFYVFGLVLFLIAGVFTVSLSWIVVLACCTLLFVFSQFRNIKIVLLTVFGAIATIVIIRVLLTGIPKLIEAFTTRMTHVDIGTGHGRTELLLDYHNAFWSNPRFIFLGTGVTQYKQVLQLSDSFHNMIQQIFVSYGIPAGLVFFGVLLSPLRNIEPKQTTIQQWIPIIAVFLFTQTIQFINPESLMLPYIPAYYLLFAQSTKEGNDETLYYHGGYGGR